MFRKLLFTSFLFFSLFIVIYPSKKESTKLIDYCYSLEKILSRNSIETRKNVSGKVKSISKDIAKFGTNKTRGALMNKIIDQYKTSKNSLIINFLPNKLFCFAGYWIETVKPGTFESILNEKTKKSIDEFKNFKDEVDGLLNDINSEYRTIKKEFKILF